MKKSKRVLALLLSSAMALSMLAGCGSEETTAAASGSDTTAETTEATTATSNDKVVKIGVYEPASGDNGAGGKQETLGIQYANTVQPTVEIGGETYTVELEIVDNQSSTEKGPSAAQQLVSAGVSVVLGSYGSGVSIAASDVFKNGGVPAIGVTCTNPQVTEGNEHYFRICFLDPF
jgi:branched-chain amino acid transport system substrate-binding protein